MVGSWAMPDARQQLQVRMDPEVIARLKAEAHARVVSVTFLVERIVADWLDKQETPTP